MEMAMVLSVTRLKNGFIQMFPMGIAMAELQNKYLENPDFVVCDRIGIPVLCYGLRTDFRGEPFDGSKYLLAWADELIEIKTICHTGKKATMNARLDADGNRVLKGEQVEIGTN